MQPETLQLLLALPLGLQAQAPPELALQQALQQAQALPLALQALQQELSSQSPGHHP